MIPGEVNLEIPTKLYKDQWREHMVINGMWYFFSMSDPHNQVKKWGLLINQSFSSLVTWNSTQRSVRRVLWRISTWFRNWNGQECTWGLLCQMLFFKNYWKFPPNYTRINDVSIWSLMGCGISSLCQTLTTKWRSGAFLSISLFLPWLHETPRKDP